MDNRKKCVRYVSSALKSSFPSADSGTIRKAREDIMRIVDKYADACIQVSVASCIAVIGHGMAEEEP